KIYNSDKLHLSVFPSERPFLCYIYTPKMDIYQLVYDLGGIIGLWFGLSAYSILIDISFALYHQIMRTNINLKRDWIKRKLLGYFKTNSVIDLRKHKIKKERKKKRMKQCEQKN